MQLWLRQTVVNAKRGAHAVKASNARLLWLLARASPCTRVSANLCAAGLLARDGGSCRCASLLPRPLGAYAKGGRCATNGQASKRVSAGGCVQSAVAGTFPGNNQATIRQQCRQQCRQQWITRRVCETLMRQKEIAYIILDPCAVRKPAW